MLAVSHTFNPSGGEAEGDYFYVPDEPRQYNAILSEKKKNQKEFTLPDSGCCVDDTCAKDYKASSLNILRI